MLPHRRGLPSLQPCDLRCPPAASCDAAANPPRSCSPSIDLAALLSPSVRFHYRQSIQELGSLFLCARRRNPCFGSIDRSVPAPSPTPRRVSSLAVVTDDAVVPSSSCCCPRTVPSQTSTPANIARTACSKPVNPTVIFHCCSSLVSAADRSPAVLSWSLSCWK
ncbi:hypothetical protein M0R45_007024 [Rubus argutus]|uniref:Uncharacterized protein n=1 Tax=Rubus argutus TaxID=59490 RepID=A0AAW1YS90_RUBAR